jgi:hypothetical protein
MRLRGSFASTQTDPLPMGRGLIECCCGCHAGEMKRFKALCVVVGLGVSCSALGLAQEKGGWRAASSAAKSTTGDVGFSEEKISINFAGFWIAQIRALEPAELSAAFDAASDGGGSGHLYRVSIPGDKKFLRKNTLCGGDDAQWVATYVVGHSLQLAFFSGSKMPVFTAEALASSTSLCGVFSYAKE